MLYILLGADNFTKRQYINTLVTEKNADLVIFGAFDQLPNAHKFTETDLFSKPKVFVLEDISILSSLPRAGEVQGEVDNLDKLVKSSNHIIISIATLDKRKKINKELFANTSILAKEFPLPHGQDFDKWILQRTTELGGKIDPEAAGELALRLGRDEAKETRFGGKVVSVEEVYNLWQADNEIRKLLAYAFGRKISREDVLELVIDNLEIDVFSITKAIAEKQKQKALDLISRFLGDLSLSDEKSGVIQLNALLSEQFRNVAMVQDFMVRKASEAEILEKTGWQSGRLFVMKKIASRFEVKIILNTLKKLAALEEELKTSSTPPKVLLDLILAQIL